MTNSANSANHEDPSANADVEPKRQFIEVTSTCSNHEEAKRLAELLVERKLAACVQISPSVESVYRWKGAIETSTEYCIHAKTVAELYTAVESAIRADHSYDTPQVMAIPVVAGSTEYLEWLADQLGR